MPHPAFVQRGLLQRASLQDRTASKAAEIAEEAERFGNVKAAEMFWQIARQSRVQALKLRAEAEARRIKP